MSTGTQQPGSLRVAVYCRISQDRDDESQSPERQEAVCRALIESKGWTVVGAAYVDRDLSAYKKRVKRPGLDALWRDLAAGKFDAVCVWKLDRLTRRFVEAGPILSRLDEQGAELLSVVENIDTSTPMGKATVGVLIAQAEQESLNTSLRVSSARQAEALAGKHHGGRRCFGYETDRSLHPVEYPIAREIVTRILAGDSQRSVVTWLNSQGVPTAAGNRWQAVTLKQWLRSPAIAGIRTHKDVETPGTWQPILQAGERDQLLMRLGTISPSGQPATVRNLLSGFAVCGVCGSRLYVQGAGPRDREGVRRMRYCCRRDPGFGACGRVFVAKTSLEAVVVERLLAFWVNVQRRPVEDERDIAALRQDIADDETALLDLGRQRFVFRKLSDSDYQTLSEEIRSRLATSKATLAIWERSTPADFPTGDRAAVEEWWEAASLEIRRAALAQSVEAVIVDPASVRGRNFDPSRVGVRFRFDAFGGLPDDLSMDEFGNIYRIHLVSRPI